MLDMIEVQSNEYFQSLPEMYKETIAQSGIRFADTDELRAFVQHLEDNHA